MPSWDRPDPQTQSCTDAVLTPAVHARQAVEVGTAKGWHRYVVGDGGEVLGVEGSCASAPAGVLLSKYGFTVDNVVRHAHPLLAALRRGR